MLSLFLFHFSGSYVFFAVRLVAIHKEMRKKLKSLPDDHFEIIQLPAAAFKKVVTAENEIEWQGKMYDIGKLKVSSDQFILFVIHDKAEDDLLSFLDEIIKRSETDSWEAPSQVLAFITLIFIPNENVFQFHQVISPVQISVYTERLYSVMLPIDSPPPQS